MKKILSSLVFLALIGSSTAYAQSLSVRSGNVFLKGNDGKERQLTRSGHDSEPTLSADGKWVAFVREIPNKADEFTPTADISSRANELWLVATEGKTETLLVKYGALGMKDYRISAIHHPQFFPDNHRIAFTSALAVVEGAVYSVDLRNRKIQFISVGNSLDVIPSGDYRNRLIVQKHKYFVVGGTYDWYWIVDDKGNEIGVIGDEENYKQFLADFL